MEYLRGKFGAESNVKFFTISCPIKGEIRKIASNDTSQFMAMQKLIYKEIEDPFPYLYVPFKNILQVLFWFSTAKVDEHLPMHLPNNKKENVIKQYQGQVSWMLALKKIWPHLNLWNLWMSLYLEKEPLKI